MVVTLVADEADDVAAVINKVASTRWVDQSQPAITYQSRSNTQRYLLKTTFGSIQNNSIDLVGFSIRIYPFPVLNHQVAHAVG